MSIDCTYHGKVLHRTRRSAKRVARLRGDRMSVYVCEVNQGYHIGHLPAPVKQGRLDRAELRKGRPR